MGNMMGSMMNAIDIVNTAREKNRPTALDFIGNLFDGFIEFHGDRRFGDDASMIAGIGTFKGMPVTVIGLEKGHDTKEKLLRNFGSAHPEGYRKALRHMCLAEKFRRPVVCIVDTAGAYCGLGAEERGQGQAIAENLMCMMGLTVPILSLIIGEGGSGGALALAVADEVWMLENAYYSVISPEGCASILWKDATKVAKAAGALKLTAVDLYELNVIERIIGEHNGDFSQTYEELKEALYETLVLNRELSCMELTEKRYARFRKMGGAV